VEPVGGEEREVAIAPDGFAKRLAGREEHPVYGVRGLGVGDGHVVPEVHPVGGGPDHVEGRPGTGVPDRLGEHAGVLNQVDPALGQRRRALLHHHEIPASLLDRGQGVTPVPVILEGVTPERHRLVVEIDLTGGISQGLHHGREVVGVGQAVADEEDPDLDIVGRRRGATAGEGAQRQRREQAQE